MQAANAAVQHLVTSKGKDVAAGGKGKRKYTLARVWQAQRAKIAKYAVKNGNAAAVRHFSKVFPGLGEVQLDFSKGKQRERKGGREGGRPGERKSGRGRAYVTSIYSTAHTTSQLASKQISYTYICIYL